MLVKTLIIIHALNLPNTNKRKILFVTPKVKYKAKILRLCHTPTDLKLFMGTENLTSELERDLKIMTIMIRVDLTSAPRRKVNYRRDFNNI